MQLFSLTDILDPKLVGAKAGHLSLLTAAKLPVPAGFVIPAKVFADYVQGRLDITTFKEKINASHDAIAAKKYMVRSSAIGEDSDENSFAGQLESFQSEGNVDEIWKHIKRCWESYSKENVVRYQEFTGRQLNGMAVIVQELIEPEYAGVLFTRSHLHAANILVEYVEGHGEQLVSGAINPFQFHYCLKSGATKGDYKSLFAPLIQLAKKIEKHYGYPCDVEWAFKDGQFYIVQSRPITTPIKEKRVYWSNTNVNENYPDPITPFLYSIARQSYYHYFKNLSKLFSIPQAEIRKLESAYSNVIGIHGAKMYYNMTSIHEILSASPFSEMLIKSFDNFVGYADGNKATTKKANTREKLTFIKEFIQNNRKLEQNVQDFENMADNFIANVETAISHEEIKRCYFEFIEIRMHSWYKASLADFYAMVYHGVLGKFCESYYNKSGVGIQNKLIQAIPGIISSQPVIEMHQILEDVRTDPFIYEAFNKHDAATFWHLIQTDKKVVKTKNAIDSYLNKWGFRCSGELMLTEKNYIEQPESFIALLQQYEKLPKSDPKQLIEEKHAEALQTIKAFKRTIFKKHGLNFPKSIIQSFVLDYLIKKAQQGIASRERARYKQALLYFGLKRTLLKIEKNFIAKGILKNAGDIFYLTNTEIAEQLEASNISGKAMQSEIELRKLNFQAQCKDKFPDEFYTEDGTYFRPEQVEVKIMDTQSKSDLKGLCACGGKIKGIVKVLHSVLEAGKINQGDILVTRQTDPGWVVVFPLISGLIVERGGMLSHGAIVSREFGIPAIVGVENATQLLKDGDQIILNADNGEITRCEK